MKAETELRIRDIEGTQGRLEDAKKLLEAQNHSGNDEVDNHIEEAVHDVEDAISKCDDELRGLNNEPR